jgi:hypothetical protein
VVFTAAVVMSVVAAAVSLARGKRYVHTEAVPEQQAPEVAAATPAEGSGSFPQW